MRRRQLPRAALAAAAATALPAAAQAAGPDQVALASWGSFHVGGRLVELSGKPVREVVFSPGGVPAKVDPNGTYMTGAMYANYMVPARSRGAAPPADVARRRAHRGMLGNHAGRAGGLPALLPPSRLAGVCVPTRWRRGRAGWSMYPDIIKGEPVFLTVDNPYERFRIGDGPGSYARGTTLPGCTFPVDKASYLQFTKQNVPRWTTTDDAIVAAYIALMEKVGPSVVMVHSQGGLFGWTVAQARPDLFRALVLLEPAAMPPPDFPKLKGIPQLVVYGDNIDKDTRWPIIRGNGIKFAEGIRAAGGTVDVVDLPQKGIKGNSHMMMMDHNSDQVAALVQDWLAAKGLYA